LSKDEKFVGLQDRGSSKVVSGPAMDLLLQKTGIQKEFPYVLCHLKKVPDISCVR